MPCSGKNYAATEFFGDGIGQPKHHEPCAQYQHPHITRIPSGPACGGAGAPLPPLRRWHAASKVEIVLRLLRGESLDALSRELALPIARLEAWHQEGLAGLHAGLSSRPDADPLQFRLDDANRRIGELSMEVELLRIKAARALPFPARRSLK